MARILISGYYGFDNLGDELLLAALLRELEQALPGSQITVLSANPAATRACHGVDALQRMDFQTVLHGVERCDLLISGGGSLLQDGTSGRSLWYYLGLLALAQSLGKRTMVYSQGAGPLLRPWNRALTRRVLSGVSAITLRDLPSQALLESLGLTLPVTVTADPVLGLPLERGTCDPRQLGWIVHGRYCTPELCRTLAGALERLSRWGYTCWLLPFCPREDGPVLDDLSRWGRVTPRAELWRRLKGCGLVASMRLHGLILGARLGAEPVALGREPKSDAFLESLGRTPGPELASLTGQALAEGILARLWGPRPDDGPQLARLAQRLEGNRAQFRQIFTLPS